MVLKCWFVAALSLLPLRGGPVAGLILADDGMPLPQRTTVSLTCETRAFGPVGVDARGGFAIADSPDPEGCVLRIDAPGYRQASVATENLPLDQRIPVAVLHRVGKNDGESISVAHLAAPAEAVRLFHSAVRELRRGPQADASVALSHFQEAVRAFPKYAQAWFEIGRLRLARGEPGNAVKAFGRAVEADPWFVSPYEPLILLLAAAGEEAEAAAACDGLRRINPDLPPDCSGR